MNDVLIVVLVLAIYFSPVFFQLSIVIKEKKKGNQLPYKKLKKALRVSLIILTPILVIFLVLIRINFLDYEKPIPYDRIEEISFENFRGLEFFKKTLYGNERYAYIVTSIELKYHEDYIIIQSFFHPSRSYVYNNATNSPDLLKHELYHFKVTELYARKARKLVSVLKNPTKNDIDKIVGDIWLKERNFQKKYDFDTFHSYVFSEQKRYEQKIDSLLLLLEKFKNPRIKPKTR
ncbi:hypothetical protein M3P19_01740 [Muricauda sp. 2012CJ35-5]|uniref:DUF4157 domain-containing protein n=1 Tax=Flagellimonas spongiicola TaxID=2942208 RepID=A0ABT0PPU2_9FLAO|nr:hypothetical protein [Allomuricauda spongiicola]MCL6272707.1 hypothetical protein [Allomuricauda spongiicola]